MRLPMNLRDQIDSHEYLYLAEIGEPEVNVLRVVVDEAKSSTDANVEIPYTPFLGKQSSRTKPAAVTKLSFLHTWPMRF